MAAGPPMQVRNLKEFRADLKLVGKEWPGEVTKVHKSIALRAAAAARAEAHGMGRQRAKASTAIKGYGTQTSASVGISGSPPYAASAFWGSNKRTGWYADSKYSGSRAKQFPKWVGNNWEAATYGQGPYAINNALAREVPHLMAGYEKAIEDVARRAFH